MNMNENNINKELNNKILNNNDNNNGKDDDDDNNNNNHNIIINIEQPNININRYINEEFYPIVNNNHNINPDNIRMINIIGDGNCLY